MAIPVPYPFSGASRVGPRPSALAALVAIALCGCSINLGSLSPEPNNEVPPKAAVAGNDARAYTTHGEALARSGKTEEALAEFDKAIALDPHNAEALYNRGLLYQGEKQHQLAIDDFTAANGLTPQQAEPPRGRAPSGVRAPRLAVGEEKGAARRSRRGGASRSAERTDMDYPGAGL